MGNRYLNVVWLSGEPSFRHKPTGSVACFATTTTTAMDEPEPPELFPEQIHHFGETNLTSAGGLTLLQIFLSMIPEVKKVGIRGKCSRYVVQSLQWRLLISPFLVWFPSTFAHHYVHMLEAIWILSKYAYCDVQYAFCRNFCAIWT
jgi:hypothetical protein